MSEDTVGRGSRLRPLWWGATFVAYPFAGLVAMWSVGAVDDPGSAALGGAIVGTVVGSAQALGSRAIDPRLRLDARTWVPASALGMGAGLVAGTAIVDYATTLPALAVLGAITGIALGSAQALALPRGIALTAAARAAWALATPVVLATGWAVTTLAGVDVDQQFAIFGATGALVATALTGVLLGTLVAHARARGAASGSIGGSA